MKIEVLNDFLSFYHFFLLLKIKIIFFNKLFFYELNIKINLILTKCLVVSVLFF